MFNFDVFTNENNVKHNIKKTYISDHDESPIVLL